MSKKGATQVLKDHIWNDICQGASQTNLVTKITQDLYNVGYTLNPHSAKDLIAKVRREMREDLEEEKKEMRGVMLQRLLTLYNESLEIGDRRVALDALKEINKVTGLYETNTINNIQVNNNIVTIDFNLDEN